MFGKSVAAITVSSSAVSAYICKRGVNNTFEISFCEESPYEGFSDGAFFDEDEFSYITVNLLKNLKENAKGRINKIYVGVPSAFIRIETKKLKKDFKKVKRIKYDDVVDLFDAGEEEISYNGFEVVMRSPVNFILDDNAITFDPVGKRSSVLLGYLSYYLVSGYFTEKINKAAETVGIEEISFVYDGFAEGAYLLGKSEKEIPSIIVDVGYISTGTLLFRGRGVIAKDSCDFGDGYITASFVEKYSLSIEAAEALKRSVNLGLKGTSQEYYSVENEGTLISFPVREVNSIVVERLDELSGNLDDFIEEISSKTKRAVSIYLTGSGLKYIRGAKEHISKRICLPVDIIAPDLPTNGRIEDSLKFAVLDFALKDNEKNNENSIY
ncbi:MAG: hypothetical protein IJ800_02040 [Clostridia bacterium]|nr:hypothetical protein [Clostridia bacterium]